MSLQPVIVALDFPDANRAMSLLEHWKGEPKPWIKVGYELFYAVGPAWVAQQKEEGYSIFLDLKLHDIPNTVAQGVKSLQRLGVDLLTLHASGGSAMISAAREAAEQTVDHAARTQLLVVTQLTSTDQSMLNDELRISGSITDSVTHYASLAHRAGADGVICSGHEAARVKQVTATEFLAVTPGIRPLGAGAQDQKRVMTPTQAVLNGADYLVVGRPITQAASPLTAYQQIVAEVREAKEQM